MACMACVACHGMYGKHVCIIYMYLISHVCTCGTYISKYVCMYHVLHMYRTIRTHVTV